MRAPRTRTTNALRRLTALGLVAWLAGAGCVLGCSAVTASAHHAAPSQTHAAQDESHNESHSAGQTDSCAAMSGHGCCAGVGRESGEKKDDRSSVAAGRHGGRTAMHCPLGGRRAADTARKVRVDTTPDAAAPAAQSPAPESSYAAPPHAARLPVRDRGGTHLRCCVFLI